MSITFRAMNTDVLVAAPLLAPPDERRLAYRVEELFEESERRFSRFREDSELSQLNRTGHLARVSPTFLQALVRARRYAEHTGGCFNVAVGRALMEAGYDRSFAPGKLDRPHGYRAASAAVCGGVWLDPKTREVQIPPGTVLDFGGFIKGWTVDQAAKVLPDLGAIDAGGDAFLKGRGVDGNGWLVDVEDPSDATRTLATLRVANGAVATSAPNRRRWRIGGEEQHHLIDPCTGASAVSDLAQVTVLAPTAEEADVLAKATFILGSERGRLLLGQRRVGAVLVHQNGEMEYIGDVEKDRAA